MSTVTHRLRQSFLLVAATAVAVMVAPQGSASAAPPGSNGYQGTAFATSVTIGSVVTSGRTALTTFACGTPAGVHKQNSIASVDVSNLLTTGTAATSGDTSASPTTSTTSSTVQSVNALGGLVTAGAVTSVSTSSTNGSTFSTSAQGTTFANLKVLGLPVLLGPSPNTRLTLPGVGYVVLNEQKSTVTAASATLQVNAIHVVVNTVNLQGFEVGTNIIVAAANSGLTAPIGGALSGIAYGTQVAVGSLVTSSPTFRVSMPCSGTAGAVRSSTGAGVNVPNIISSGTITDTAQGSTTVTTAMGEMTSTVQTVNLLNGVVTATGIKSVATANRNSVGSTTTSSTGSQFATISVNGVPLVVGDIAPNTVINLLGIGKLYLNRVTATSNSIQVVQIELDVLQANPLGIAIGTTVQVAVARVAIH